jgi:hypothetical protein
VKIKEIYDMSWPPNWSSQSFTTTSGFFTIICYINCLFRIILYILVIPGYAIVTHGFTVLQLLGKITCTCYIWCIKIGIVLVLHVILYGSSSTTGMFYVSTEVSFDGFMTLKFKFRNATLKIFQFALTRFITCHSWYRKVGNFCFSLSS